MEHADFISDQLNVPITVDHEAAHFSYEYQDGATYIPLCTSNRLLMPMAGRMILDSRPSSLENTVLCPEMPAHYVRHHRRTYLYGPNVMLPANRQPAMYRVSPPAK